MRLYELYSRPPMSRNKYGTVDTTAMNSSTLFGGQSSASGAASSVGGEMVQINDFVGATDSENGVRGLVPAPLAGQQDWFLQGQGVWKEIPAFKWITEFPTSKGLEKTGIQVNGDLNVTDTITTMNLEVQGAAHFWSLIVDEVKANGGQVLVSPSSFVVDYIGDIYYYNVSDYNTLIQSRDDINNAINKNSIRQFKCRRLYQRNDDSSKKITNECQIGDMMRCRQFNIQPGAYNNVKNDDWWSFVAAVGEESYETPDGVTYPAFYIDIVYGLITTSGSIVPIGSVLSTSAADIDYPDNWSGEENVDELKKVSQKTLDGTQVIETETIDSEEMVDVTNQIIKIRGLDGSIRRLVGLPSSTEVDNDNIDDITDQLDVIANGVSASNSSDPDDLTSLVLYGTHSDEGSNLDDVDMDNATELSQSIRSNTRSVPKQLGLKQETKIFDSFMIEKNTAVTVPLVAAEEITDTNNNVYSPGDIIPAGKIIKYDGFVSLGESGVDYYEYNLNNPSQETQITGEKLEELETTTPNTSFNSNRNVDRITERHYDERTEWVFGYGEFTIKVGDQLACLGHLFDPSRQNAIVISSTNPIDPDLEPPCIAQYNYIDTFGTSISDYRITAIAANGNEFIGSFLVQDGNTYFNIDERINMFITDIKNGLETVGIHLDGENSTITLVGNIDIRQHSSTSYDSVNMYDNKEIKRLEISPFEIPKRDAPNQQFGGITNKTFNFNGTSTTTTIPTDYVKYSTWKDWDGPFYYYLVHRYKVENYQITHSETISLGSFEQGYKLDISNLDFHIELAAWVGGQAYMSDYQMNNIKVYYTLTKNGSGVGKTSIDISNYITKSPADGKSNVVYLKSTQTLLDDWTIPGTGNYSINIRVVFDASMMLDSYSKSYSNYYVSTQTRTIGKGEIIYSVDPGGGTSNADMSLRKMTIGTNGFSFVGNNSRYFYAATDGYEMKWDDVSVGLDATAGIKMVKKVYTTSYIISNRSGIVPPDADVVITMNKQNAQTITLYNGSANLGNGKTVNVVDCLNVTINNCSHPKTLYAIDKISDGDGGEMDISRTVRSSARSFVWYNKEWYEI